MLASLRMLIPIAMVLRTGAAPACSADASDVGSRVRSESRLGEAERTAGRKGEARQHLEAAVREWLTPAALSWIRSLPADDASARAIERVSEAASAARLALADLNAEDATIPLKRFHPIDAKLPLASVPDSALSADQRAQRERFLRRYAHNLMVYAERILVPWARRQQPLLQRAELEYQDVLLMPPWPAARIRVAVYARIGALWWRYVSDLRSPDRSTQEVLGTDFESVHHGWFEEPGENEKQRARIAFEACVTLSRKYHILTSDTLDCEEWLGTHYRSMYSRYGELAPYPDLPGPTDLLGRARPSPR